ncbi:LAQU0S02e09978g1_1 [Lachancea quebecensis]|uniref:Acyl-coenzyme A diphosphatase SCS3 n=1 Tax=Lachancea quebecensis TaxID=1654605 RepID=A0A0N7ML47_9SACH|nr:LAQU0S02e09978g1_1 [Lachancea quebecensis]
MELSLYKIFLFSLCPLTLLVGQLVSFRVHLEVDKDGWLNTYFVKQGWFWTSLVGWWCMIRYGGFGPRGTWKRTLLRYAILTVWWFVFTQSLWSEAAPLMDMVFTATGGRCSFEVFDSSDSPTWSINEKFHDTFSRRQSSLQKLYAALKKGAQNPPTLLQNAVSEIGYWISEGKGHLRGEDVTPSQLNSLIDSALHSWKKINSSYLCRSLGGYWIGGHDPSGHIFLITLMCMFLLGELQAIGKRALRVLKTHNRYWQQLREHGTNVLTMGGFWNLVAHPPATKKQFFKQLGLIPPNIGLQLIQLIGSTARFIVWDNPVVLLVLFTFLWWWSLLITTIAFHTLWEQLSGLLCAYVVAGFVYWKLV